MPVTCAPIASLLASPKQRPTTEELIRMLPAKVEDSSVREMLNALSNKDTSAHTTLMQTIFGQVALRLYLCLPVCHAAHHRPVA